MLRCMMNVILLSQLTTRGSMAPQPISCPICHEFFESESRKSEHLESAHPGWAMTMMLGYLQKIPRENG